MRHKIWYLNVLADGRYSNAQGIASCEHDNVKVLAPIKRVAMSVDFFRAIQPTYDEETDTTAALLVKRSRPRANTRATVRSDIARRYR